MTQCSSQNRSELRSQVSDAWTIARGFARVTRHVGFTSRRSRAGELQGRERRTEMFSIRQALRLGARAARAQYPAYRSAPTLCESNDVGPLRHVRLAHEDAGRNLGKLEGKMRLMFTCKKCDTRTSKLISKLAYEKGVVIVRCDGCKNNHLIADNLGWFSEINRSTNIEKIMALKGETVRRIINDVDGYYEAVSKEESKNEDASEVKPGDECPDEIKMIEKSKS